MKLPRTALVLASALMSGTAFALPYTESGDAGSLAGSAQTIGANITSISGTTGNSDTEDLYRFSWGGGLFEAATDGKFGSSRSFDTMLFLFDSNGSFIAANDDIVFMVDLGSYLSVILNAGDYFLGISGFSNDALNAGGNAFREGATGVLANWEGGGASGSYVIGINAPTVASAVPEPGMSLLIGAGLLGMLAARRRRHP